MAELLFGAGLITIRERAFEPEGNLAPFPIADCGGCGGCGPLDMGGEPSQIGTTLSRQDDPAPTHARQASRLEC